MLDATLSATATGEGVELALAVENTGDDAVTLSFRDGQRAEYVAERAADGGAVWRYSDDRAFAMALADEDIPAGDAATYTATWPDPPAGEYRVRAWVVATNAKARAETTVTVD